MAYFLGNLRKSLGLAYVEGLHALLAEMACVELGHDVVQFVQGAIGLLGILGIADGLVVPVVGEQGIVGIGLQHLHFLGQVLLVQHPLGQVVGVQVFLSVVLVALLVDEALVFTPVVVLELIQHAFAHGVSDVLQDAEFRIHHTLDTERSYFLCSCNRNPSISTGIGSLVVLIGKVIHILVSESMLDGHQIIGSFVHHEYACEDVVADYLGQFLQGIDGNAVFVHIAVNGKTVGHTLYPVAMLLCFSSASNILGEPASCLQGIEFCQCGIAVLVVAALVHVCLRQMHLRHHGINTDYGFGECLTCLHHNVYNRAGTCTAAQTCKDIDIQSTCVA